MSADELNYAAQLIELARAEETEDGNPMTAVKHYTTAMEIIATKAAQHAAAISNSDARRFFFFQVRSRLEMYYERAELLLQVANGSGLLDKPSVGGGVGEQPATALPSPNFPPALFASAVANPKAQCDEGLYKKPPATSVMGIPLQPNQTTPSAQDGAAATEPPICCYLKADDDTAAPTPPVTPAVDLDELMKNLGAPPGS
ncbi:hypothetical protein ABB37_07371 [Leptomonas pyrrhocoris]|uniref:MIT domain-containing protein n=1 Tax=Leptomonas pyrrhocoris TaxID=157538 RepID=A0A0N0DT77_LEPPY|nr:hypothetical protein ABB37_07371 [Leptomonas pyrrhocoris]XP_015655461.1 hypothetical protein ABB37_07371 [Leptomonas pyrrhocoris]KPA77021.1 hypothetical protein ABB37_07371 [Leptomonas pyrrhocoris]KPA77022.1 hypothetical protein ABB37_07371 [Leptomonas pyrrhocoris]|eukprot:XP_015655460.1 hypothetical protein ABB37_07371 [Leptomonas pyrrhocoris]